MLGPPDERTPPMTPQLALRVALIGGLALLLFAVIFFRLWFLQVLTGSQYVAQAQSNVDPAHPDRGPPRRDRRLERCTDGAVGGGSLDPDRAAKPSRTGRAGRRPLATPSRSRPRTTRVFGRLAQLIGMSTKARPCSYLVFWSRGPHRYHTRLTPVACLVAKSVAQSPYANASIKTNVPTYIQDYIAEHRRSTAAFCIRTHTPVHMAFTTRARRSSARSARSASRN